MVLKYVQQSTTIFAINIQSLVLNFVLKSEFNNSDHLCTKNRSIGTYLIKAVKIISKKGLR